MWTYFGSITNCFIALIQNRTIPEVRFTSCVNRDCRQHPLHNPESEPPWISFIPTERTIVKIIRTSVNLDLGSTDNSIFVWLRIIGKVITSRSIANYTHIALSRQSGTPEGEF